MDWNYLTGLTICGLIHMKVHISIGFPWDPHLINIHQEWDYNYVNYIGLLVINPHYGLSMWFLD